MAQYNSYHWYESLFMWITLEFLQLIHGTIYNVLIRYIYIALFIKSKSVYHMEGL